MAPLSPQVEPATGLPSPAPVPAEILKAVDTHASAAVTGLGHRPARPVGAARSHEHGLCGRPVDGQP
jgi:hypothetical protein